MAQNLLYVSIGAIVGALARFLITNVSSRLSHHHGFPYGTLIVNVTGCFIVGYVLTWTDNHEQDHWRLLAATGFCGAFTTFSAFAYESLAYWHEGPLGTFFLNLGLNNILCLMAVGLGIWLHNASSPITSRQTTLKPQATYRNEARIVSSDDPIASATSKLDQQRSHGLNTGRE